MQGLRAPNNFVLWNLVDDEMGAANSIRQENIRNQTCLDAASLGVANPAVNYVNIVQRIV